MPGFDTWLWILQRSTAMVLAAATAIHLVTVIYAVQGGLTADEILARTRGNVWWLGFYVAFAAAAAVHAPIGLRTVVKEWTPRRGRSVDAAAAAAAVGLTWLGVRAAWSLYR